MRRVFLLSALLLSGLPTNHARAHDFSWDNLLLASMKLNKDFAFTNGQVDSYMQLYRNPVWREVRNNEFKLKAQRMETLRIMKERIADFSLEEGFVLNTSLRMGQYNFDQEIFPFESLAENHYWYPNAPYNRGDFPYQFRVYFANGAGFSSLPMSKDLAERFVAARTDRYGNVDRTVYATIRFKILRLKNRDYEFLAEIQSASIYNDKGRTRLLRQLKPDSTK